ncbi:MAG: response regulator transcription factor [Anaerolineae bacterium]
MSTQEKAPIRVLVVDDHPTMRIGLTVFLSAELGMECVGEAENGEQALAKCRELQPDVALVDIVMPGLDGPTVIEQITREMPSVRVIALTSYNDTTLARRAIHSGARGYLLKTVSTEDLAAAVRTVHAGGQVFTPEVTQALAMADVSDLPPGASLSDREVEILRLAAAGKTDFEIARALNISKSTARFHLTNIYGKLGAANRTEAVRIAIEHNML